MGLLATPYLQVAKGSHELLLEFWDTLHILRTAEARNFKYGSIGQIQTESIIPVWRTLVLIIQK